MWQRERDPGAEHDEPGDPVPRDRALCAWDGVADEGEGSDLGRLLEELFHPSAALGFDRDAVPAVGVSQDAHAYEVSMELPGIAREDIDVEILEGRLVVRGTKRSAREKRRAVEGEPQPARAYVDFWSSFRLPSDTEPDHVSASFRQGVLTLTLPRRPSVGAHPVPIEGGGIELRAGDAVAVGEGLR